MTAEPSQDDLHDPRTLPDAITMLAPLEERLAERTPAIFLDFDGVLAPIVDRPDMAAASPSMREAVRHVARHCRTAVISGRDRLDVEVLLDVPGLVYAGSHGFDLEGPDGIRYLAGEDWLPILDRAEAALQALFKDREGVLIDRKRFAIAIHFRGVPEAQHEAIAKEVASMAQDYPELRRKSGKMIWELQPQFDWHKGRTVAWLLEHWPRPARPWLPIYLGDDVTDEDGFEAVAATGLGILVDPDERQTRATAMLPDVEAVRVFLEALAKQRGAAGEP